MSPGLLGARYQAGHAQPLDAGARLLDGPPFATSVLGTTNGTYAATKAALNRYTNVLGVELFGTGVRVNTVEPADPVATEGAPGLETVE